MQPEVRIPQQSHFHTVTGAARRACLRTGFVTELARVAVHATHLPIIMSFQDCGNHASQLVALYA